MEDLSVFAQSQGYGESTKQVHQGVSWGHGTVLHPGYSNRLPCPSVPDLGPGLSHPCLNSFNSIIIWSSCV